MLIVLVNLIFYEIWYSLFIIVYFLFIFWLVVGCFKFLELLNGGVIIFVLIGVNFVVRYYCNLGFEFIGRLECICELDSIWIGNEF